MTHLEALESLKQGKRIDLRAIGFTRCFREMSSCNSCRLVRVVLKLMIDGNQNIIKAGCITPLLTNGWFMKNNNTNNNGFFDLPPEQRGYWYDKAREENGVDSFYDLTPEERGRYYDRATENQYDWRTQTTWVLLSYDGTLLVLHGNDWGRGGYYVEWRNARTRTILETTLSRRTTKRLGYFFWLWKMTPIL